MTKERPAGVGRRAVRKVLCRRKVCEQFTRQSWRRIWRTIIRNRRRNCCPIEKFQVLRLIASGKIVSEIARELSLRVKNHQHLPDAHPGKNGSAQHAELMHYAMQHQLVE